jgi:putative acetyltransferase
MLKGKIAIREYRSEDARALARIFYNTVHRINIQHYTKEQVDVWAPESVLESVSWAKRFLKTRPIIAVVGEQIVGFAEFMPDGHIDCFYCHHEWIGKGVGAALMAEILEKARKHHITRIFVKASITAKPFFEKHGFVMVAKQIVVRSGIELANYEMELHLTWDPW